MMQKPWMKLFIWTVTTSFFFMASGIIISALGPEPSEGQIMQFMQGMRVAMHNSLMGLSMTIEHDVELKRIIINASAITLPLTFISAILGFYVRFLRRKGDAE